MLDNQIRNELESKMKDLIASRVTPSDASYWANELFRDMNSRKVIEASPSLSFLFDSIHMSNLPFDTADSLMYDVSTFRKWYAEYKEEYAEEINETR